uniref:Uncharacterized protein n=1 Tax=Sinocyclocheilus anshuiensis TaxID=1608454 RepID=A0A671MEU5_9TELE
RRLFSLALDNPHYIILYTLNRKHEECVIVVFTINCRLIDCGLTDEDCADLALALSSDNSCLRENLDLSGNKLGNLGIKLLSDALENPYCKLETLKLWRCGLTHESCDVLASALNSNPSHLRELDLSENNLGNQGVKLFSDGLKNPQCKLETLNKIISLSDEINLY